MTGFASTPQTTFGLTGSLAASSAASMTDVIPMGVYNVTASVLNDTNIAQLQLDAAANLKQTLATALAGENITDDVMAVSPKALSSLTNAWANYSSAALVGTVGINVKASSGRVRDLVAVNTHASASYYFQAFNKATAPVNNDVPVVVRLLPPVGTFSGSLAAIMDFGGEGKGFSTGIGYAISTTAATLTLAVNSNVWVDGRYL